MGRGLFWKIAGVAALVGLQAFGEVCRQWLDDILRPDITAWPEAANGLAGRRAVFDKTRGGFKKIYQI
jgi:hypothetical protein